MAKTSPWMLVNISLSERCRLSPAQKHKELSRRMTKPMKTQISMSICPVWSLSTCRHLASLVTHWVHREDSDQAGRLGRCPGWSESSLGAFCWFCHETAQFITVLSLRWLVSFITIVGNKSNMRYVTRKPVFGTFDAVRLKLACSATKAS